MRKKKLFGALSLGVCAVTCTALGVFTGGFVFADGGQDPQQDTQTYPKYAVFEAGQGVSEMVDNVAFPSYTINTGKYASTSSGTAIYTDGGNAQFTYTHAIDFSSRTKEDALMELFAVYDGDTYAQITGITVTLADTENAENTFSIATNKSGKAIYARVNYKGKSLGRSNESNRPNYTWDSKYGTVMYGFSHDNTDSNGKVSKHIRPTSFSLDYQTKTVYAVDYDSNTGSAIYRTILDLDDPLHVGSGFEWNGFESDTAQMSISISFAQAKRGCVIMRSILGATLEGEFTGEASFPAPQIKCEVDADYMAEGMPDAGKNVAYALPKATAFDWYFGQTESVKTDVYKKNGEAYSDLIAENVTNGSFTPQTVGDYAIRYTATNGKNTSTKELYFSVVEKLPAIIIAQIEEYDISNLGINKIFTLPEVSSYGGSGKLTTKETLYYNGQEVTLSDARSVLIDKPGVLSLRVESKGYTGNTAVKYFTVEIPDETVLSVSGVPMAVISGYATGLPTATAYDSATGASVAVTVTVDGQPCTDGVLYTEKTDGFVTVVYTTADGEKTQTYAIPVISSENVLPSNFLFTSAGEITKEDGSAGITLTTEINGSEAYWSYPVVTGYGSVNAYVTLSGVAGKNNFDYIDVYFENYYMPSERAFLRVYTQCSQGAEMTTLQVNGKGTEYFVTGSIRDNSKPLQIYLDGDGNVCNGATLVPICSLGYQATVSKVSFQFGGVYGKSSIILRELSNQLLNASYDANTSTHSWTDKNQPVIAYEKPMSKTVNVTAGQKILLAKAQAYDMCSSGATISLTVTSPSGQKIIDTKDLTKEWSFTATELGQYLVMYTATDVNRKSGSDILYYNVIDNVTPVLTVSGTPKTEYVLGASIAPPKATATDNVDGDVQVYVYIRNMQDWKLTELTPSVNDAGEIEEKPFVFTKTGEYQLVYLVRDGSYNYTQYVFTITVKE